MEAGGTPPEIPTEDPLRFEFVELMFALAAAEVAVQVAPLAEQRFTVFHAPAYMHAALALLVIATSWVGWKTSKAAGNRQVIRGVFEWPFAVLVLDVLLVVFYYGLAHGVEKPDQNGQIHPSAKNETIVIALIFSGYVAWDILTKRVMDRSSTWASVWPRLRWSVLCFALALVTFALLMHVQRTAAVLLTDAALMMLVLAFRALKQPTAPRPASGICLGGWAVFTVAACALVYHCG